MYWRLPIYKRPTDPKTGQQIDIPPDQMYKLKMLDVYYSLQRKIDGLNRHDGFSEIVPVSME